MQARRPRLDRVDGDGRESAQLVHGGWAEVAGGISESLDQHHLWGGEKAFLYERGGNTGWSIGFIPTFRFSFRLLVCIFASGVLSSRLK